MFIQVLIILIFGVLIYLFNSKHTLYVSDSKVKYVMSNRDKRYIDKHSIQTKQLPENGIFYTTTPWNATNHNNYFKYKDKYYIIEPGYYYNVIPEVEFFIKNCNFITKKK